MNIPSVFGALRFEDTTVPEPIVIGMDADAGAAFEVDVERRIIRGLIVPYGKPGLSNGRWFQFSQGTLKWTDPSRVKLWIQHDPERTVGVAFELDDRRDGLYGAFRVAKGKRGDKALRMADPNQDGTLDGFSVGIRPGGKFFNKDGVFHAVEVPIMETSLTPAPSFDDARVHAVAASATTKGMTMPCSLCGQVHADGVTTCTPAPAPVVDVGAQDFSAITDAIQAGFQNILNPQAQPGQDGGREVVPAGAGFQVTREELPYRFDGIAGAHSFIEDLKGASQNNSEATQRLEEFMDEAFAVTTANVASLNPTQNRPELYVPNLTYTRPLWDLVSKGSLENKTPFTIPKFSTATGLVATHTEGVEPTPGAFTATNQTVTPLAKSGKIEIVREVWDQGGSPQADGIIWGEMLNAWFESIEAAIASQLDATSTTEVNLASAVDLALANALTSLLIGKQFARGGNRFTAFPAEQALFTALAQAKDSSNRPLFPVLGPQNTLGETSGAFDTIMVGNTAVKAAWALNRTPANASESYLFVPSSVYCWASTPKRFTFEYQLKSIDMAIWGYVGTAILRDSDVIPIDYQTLDT